jgi:hypothetical protein
LAGKRQLQHERGPRQRPRIAEYRPVAAFGSE